MNAGPHEYEFIYKQACDWWAHLHSGHASQADIADFKRWFRQAAMHRQAWHEAQSTMRHISPVLADAARQRPEWSSAVAEPTRGWGGKRRRFLAGAMAAGVAGTLAWRPPFNLWPAAGEFTADLRTGTGEQKQLQFAPGVALQMNTQTRINRRSTENGPGLELLAGEAQLHVLATVAAPVQVWAAQGLTQSWGGAFNIRYTGSQVLVTCLQGQVQVQLDHQKQLLAGQQLRYGGRFLPEVEQADVQQAHDWSSGSLNFIDVPLSELIDEVNRYRPGRLVLRNPDLAQKRIRMRVHIHDMDLVPEMLRSILRAQVRELPGGIAFIT